MRLGGAAKEARGRLERNKPVAKWRHASPPHLTHQIMNSTPPIVDQLVAPIVFHNETFGSFGLKHDVAAPMWTRIATGVALVCLCVGVCACVIGSRAQVKQQTSYESLPLVTIRLAAR